MIMISGAPGVVDTSSWSSVAKNIYALKMNSPVTYNYESVHHLRFEMSLRSATVAASAALGLSGMRFAVYEHAQCNEQFWELTPQGGFNIRDGVTPAVGIRDIFENGTRYATECSTASVIVLYKGVLDAIRENDFNRLFAGLMLFDWHIDDDLRLTRQSGVPAYPGDLLYFDNPDYSPDTPHWRGENAIKIDNDLYYGHPFGIVTAESIIAFLNHNRSPGSSRSAYLTEDIIHPDYSYLSQFAPHMRPHIFAWIGSQRVIC